MEAPLIDEWLGTDDGDRILMLDDASVSSARQRAREVALSQGMTPVAAERLAMIASELGYNQLRHARRGQIAVRPITRSSSLGVEIIAVDEGDGIANPSAALEGVARDSGSLGSGIAAARRHANEMDFDVRIGEGTCVRARVWAGEVARRREVGIFGRPCGGEQVSGDHAAVFRTDARLLLAVCDGLGHGAPARLASDAAVRAFGERRDGSPASILEECHSRLHGTRGAVMAVAAVREGDPPALDVASVGNITIELVQPRSARRCGASSFVVGSQQRGWRQHVESSPIEDGEVLVMFTDGIASRASISEEVSLLREHPIAIAYQLAARFGREDDDVLVLVAR
jgi:anti-sigma regulatory factor (Ser/Thr protein kinase)